MKRDVVYFTYVFFAIKFIYADRKRIFSLIFVAAQCEH